MFHVEKGLWVKIKKEWERERKEEGGITLNKEERETTWAVEKKECETEF